MNAKIKRWTGFGVVLIAVLAAGLMLWTWKCSVRPVSVQDERAAAEALLTRKLSGPRYFNAPEGAKLEGGILWIEPNDAWGQVPRIVAERKLGPEATKTIGRLIERLSEPHPYRVVGGRRINLARLNLSLDSIK